MKIALKYIVLLLALLWGVVFADSIKLTWDAAPATDPKIIRYDIFKWAEGKWNYLASTPGTVGVTVDVQPGTDLAIAAQSQAGLWGPMSEKFTYVPAPLSPTPPLPPSKPTGLRILPIKASTSLNLPKDQWPTVGYFVVPPEPDGSYPERQFFISATTATITSDIP